MKLIIPLELLESINSYKRKDVREAAMKVACGLLKQNKRKNPTTGWFDVPSTYLKSLNLRYKRFIDKFIQDGHIKYYSRPTIDEKNIFNSIEKKYYNTTLGFCMKYKFLIDTEVGIEYDFNSKNPNSKRWYEVLKSSLISLGYEPKIGRDDFGRRVHHPAIFDYKTNLANRGFSVIDATCSQPRLLYLLMKQRGYYDEKYFKIFENNNDFYYELIANLGIKDRQEGKELFNSWSMGDGYVPELNIYKLFPVASSFLATLKSRSYKDASAYLQREEARIWIDDLLENIPVSFALSVHDAFIVKSKDANKVLNYCRQKYPDIVYKLSQL